MPLSPVMLRTDNLQTGIADLVISIPPVWLEEQHKSTLATTEYPVESGANIVDHASRKPFELTLRGTVSPDQGILKMPQATGILAQVVGDEAPLDRRDLTIPAKAWEAILELQSTRSLLTVTTILGSYPNMLITEAAAPVTTEIGKNLLFTLELKEILSARQLVGLDRSIVAITPPANERTSIVTAGIVPASDVEIIIKEAGEASVTIEERSLQTGGGNIPGARLSGTERGAYFLFAGRVFSGAQAQALKDSQIGALRLRVR